MNDQKRAALKMLVTTGMALLMAFGLDLTTEQSVGIVAFFDIAMTVFMLFWKSGQEPETANPP